MFKSVIGRKARAEKTFFNSFIVPNSTLFYFNSESPFNKNLINENSASCPLNRPVGTKFSFYLGRYENKRKYSGNGTYQPRVSVRINNKKLFSDTKPEKNWAGVDCADSSGTYDLIGAGGFSGFGNVVSGTGGSLLVRNRSNKIESYGTVFVCEDISYTEGYVLVVGNSSTSIRDVGSTLHMEFVRHF